MSLLLIHPPLTRACEPPAGLARLSGALQAAGVAHRLLDANLEGQLWLLQQPLAANDTWTRRALRGRKADLAALRTLATYANPARHGRAVRDLNRVLAMAGRERGARLRLTDFQQPGRSPVSSADLLAAAAHPEENPFFPWFEQRLPQLLAGTRLVGISLNYLSQALCAFALLGWLRRRAPDLTLVLGGGLVTSWLAQPDWQDPFAGLIDHLLPGPGEAALLPLCGGAPGGGPHPPRYTDLPLDDYLAPGRILPYSAADGCWWRRCSFCPEQVEGSRYRPLPVPQVLRELRSLTAELRPVLLHLLDNALSPALLRGLAAQPPGAPWYGFARIDPQLTDPAFCRALRRAGCVMLQLGLESGDQGVLERLRKGIDLALAERVLTHLREAGIAVYGYLLFGTPAEDEAAAHRTLAFAVRNAAALSFLNVALFNLPARGAEAAALDTAPFYPGDLSLYRAFRHPRGWDRGRVRRFVEQEFSRHPALAPILQRDPPFFTSSHAPLLSLATARTSPWHE